LAKNEALFRDVNERIAEVTESLTEEGADLLLDGLVCECVDPLCTERLGALTPEEYEAIRSDARRFLVVPQHDDPEEEVVLERRPAYWIVEKHEGIPSDVARKLDPRAS
jgi:hypothetical protein